MAQHYSLNLDLASSQYAGIADGSQTGLDVSGDFTIEAWIKLDSLPSASDNMHIAGKHDFTGNQRGYRLYITTADKLALLATEDGTNSNNDVIIADAATFTSDDVGKWVHVAGTYDLSMRDATLYKDGQEIASTPTNNGTMASVQNSTAPFNIGARGTGDEELDGRIKYVRIFSDIRTASEIRADAAADEVSDGNLEGEWKLENSYADTSGNSNTLSGTNSPIFVLDSPVRSPASFATGDKCLDLEAGSSQYGSIADGDQTGLDLNSTCTFEAWVKLESLPSSGNLYALFSKWGAGGGDAGNSYFFGIENSAGDYRLTLSWNEETDHGTSTGYQSFAFETGKWYHLAAVITDLSTPAVTFYINGKAYSATMSASDGNNGTINDSSADFFVGAHNSSSPGSYLDGEIRDARVFSDVRTQSEILADAVTDSVSDGNLEAEWNLNDAYTDASGNSNDLTGNGSPTFVELLNAIGDGIEAHYAFDDDLTDDTKNGNDLTHSGSATYGTGIINNGLDLESGSSEYASITDGAQTGLDLTTDFTIAGWIKPESFPTVGHLLAKWEGVAGKRSYAISIRDSGATIRVEIYNGSTTSENELTTSLSAGTLYHVVITYDLSAGTAYLYVDGVLVDIVSGGNTSIADGGGDFHIGASGNDDSTKHQFYDGIVDEMTVYSRFFHYGDVIDHFNADAGLPWLAAVETSDERAAEIHGQDSANDERAAELHGEDTANSERAGELHGVDTDNDERAAELHGSQDDNDERAAELHGIDTTEDERAAEVTGAQDDANERAAEMHGIDTTESERAAETHGSQDDSDERAAEVHGIDTTESERAAEVHGEQDANSERDAETTGIAATNDERDAEIHGQDTANDERAAEVTGQIITTSERDAEVHGVDTDSAERAAEVHGQDTDSDERAAELTGVDTANSERSAETNGTNAASDERASELIGEDTANSERSAEMEGTNAVTSQRDAEVHGTSQANSERGARLTGIGKYPYTPSTSPYSPKTPPYSSKTSPFTPKTSPYSPKTTPYTPYPKS